jgi:energy-coupling factor transporter ATP-binding protein EcfA2
MHLLPLLWEEGLLVHSALVADDAGSGVLACGPSGAGKSTLARLARGRALSDELAAVKLEGRQPISVALPFWESRPGRARLRAVLHIGHGTHHRLEPLLPEEALRRLATLILWPVWNESAMARSFAYLTEIVETVPAFDLSFAPTGDVWDFIDKEVS